MGLVGRAASFGKAALSKLTSFEAVVKPREIESDHLLTEQKNPILC